MIYQSDSLSVQRLEGGIAELNFDRQGESVNKFDQQTVASLRAALDALEAESGIRGLLVTSGKPVFIVGADITEFTSLSNFVVRSQRCDASGLTTVKNGTLADIKLGAKVHLKGTKAGDLIKVTQLSLED